MAIYSTATKLNWNVCNHSYFGEKIFFSPVKLKKLLLLLYLRSFSCSYASSPTEGSFTRQFLKCVKSTKEIRNFRFNLCGFCRLERERRRENNTMKTLFPNKWYLAVWLWILPQPSSLQSPLLDFSAKPPWQIRDLAAGIGPKWLQSISPPPTEITSTSILANFERSQSRTQRPNALPVWDV